MAACLEPNTLSLLVRWRATRVIAEFMGWTSCSSWAMLPDACQRCVAVVHRGGHVDAREDVGGGGDRSPTSDRWKARPAVSGLAQTAQCLAGLPVSRPPRCRRRCSRIHAFVEAVSRVPEALRVRAVALVVGWAPPWGLRWTLSRWHVLSRAAGWYLPASSRVSTGRVYNKMAYQLANGA